MRDTDKDVVAIKQSTFETLRDARRVWMIEETGDGRYVVRDWMPDGVSPSSEYPDKRKAAARLLQLLHVGPVAPQTWPESVCVGTITYEDEAAS